MSSIIARWTHAGRSGLLPALIETQEEFGWLSPETITQIARDLRVPLSEAYGVADFYAHLYTRPAGKKFVRVCDDICCYLAGSEKICASIQERLNTLAPHASAGVREGRRPRDLRVGETTGDGAVTFEIVPCLGHCDHAPVLMAGETVFQNAQAQAIDAALRGDSMKLAETNLRGPLLLKDLGHADSHTLDAYLARGGFGALKKALTQMIPAQIVAEVKASGLIGRGGAAFPTGLKWELAAQAVARQTLGDAVRAPLAWRDSAGYIVCNADESETGTFKDRVIMERNPFALIEAMAIAARAIDAQYGYIYVRGEYPLAAQRLQDALATARAKNFLGEKILGGDLSFEIELRHGAGAYVCGEETALFESIEGKRGEPRAKPPFPTDDGLFGKPTIINNVETFANVPFIILNGASAYRRFGTEKSPGTRVVCVSGQVKQPGVYEIEMGLPLREVIYDLAGGLHAGRNLRTVLIGGAAGVFLRPDEIEVPLDFQSLAAMGAAFGSGAIMVLDDTANMWGVLRRIARFFKEESCGKCFPCQLGTQRQLEIVERMAERAPRDGDDARLHELGAVMRDASLCGLGQTAASAILSALDKKLVGAKHSRG